MAFVLADSGNGGHLAAKIDLPNDFGVKEANREQPESAGLHFSDEKSR